MGIVNLYNVAKYGVIKDVPDHKLPPEAWTDALNVRFIDDKIVRTSGEQAVMDPPTVAPGFLMNVEGTSGSFWLYAEASGAGSKVYGFNSGTHADISKAGDYSVANFRDWNGTIFHGTPVINPVSDDPQYWSALNLATPLADLPNWPASTTCKLIRTYKFFLVALATTESSTAHPNRVKWSDIASPGSLPGSWDNTDPTTRAGIRELSDVKGGLIVDAMPLRDMLAIYKNESTWLMRFKGGTDVMEFADIMQTSGLLAVRCMTPLTLPIKKSQVHFLHNGIDLGVFNGQGFESVVQDKDRKFINNDIDPVYYQNSFAFDNAPEDEAWFCYPAVGSTRPSMVAIWNYRYNTMTFREFGGTHATSGVVELASATTWTTVSGAWTAAAASKWQEATRRNIIVADQANTKLVNIDVGDDFNGTAFDSYIERTGIALIGMDRLTNEPKADFEQRKMITRVWLKSKGGRLRVTTGFMNEFDATVPPYADYTDPSGKNTAIHDPGAGQPFVDVISEGRLLAVKIEGVDGDYYEIDGIDMDIVPTGGH